MQTLRSQTLSFEEYVKHDATALAELVRKGEVTPAELLETAIARAEAVNQQLNAIVTPLYDPATKLPCFDWQGNWNRNVPGLINDLLCRDGKV